MSRLRASARVCNGLAVAALVAGLVVVLSVWGWPSFQSGWDVVFLLPVVVWFLSPFIAVAAAVADRHSSLVAIALALGVATAGSFLVPRWIGASIENDPSSTAGLVILYSPLPVVLAVGAILGLDYVAQRLVGRHRRSWSGPAAR